MTGSKRPLSSPRSPRLRKAQRPEESHLTDNRDAFHASDHTDIVDTDMTTLDDVSSPKGSHNGLTGSKGAANSHTSDDDVLASSEQEQIEHAITDILGELFEASQQRTIEAALLEQLRKARENEEEDLKLFRNNNMPYQFAKNAEQARSKEKQQHSVAAKASEDFRKLADQLSNKMCVALEKKLTKILGTKLDTRIRDCYIEHIDTQREYLMAVSAVYAEQQDAATQKRINELLATTKDQIQLLQRQVDTLTSKHDRLAADAATACNVTSNRFDTLSLKSDQVSTSIVMLSTDLQRSIDMHTTNNSKIKELSADLVTIKGTMDDVKNEIDSKVDLPIGQLVNVHEACLTTVETEVNGLKRTMEDTILAGQNGAMHDILEKQTQIVRTHEAQEQWLRQLKSRFDDLTTGSVAKVMLDELQRLHPEMLQTTHDLKALTSDVAGIRANLSPIIAWYQGMRFEQEKRAQFASQQAQGQHTAANPRQQRGIQPTLANQHVGQTAFTAQGQHQGQPVFTAQRPHQI